MKKLFILSIMLMLAVAGRAQDVLVTESGDAIKAWGVDVAGTNIYYRESEAADAPVKSIAKSAVLMWKKADGTRVIIGQEEQKPAAPAAATTPAAKTPAPDASDPEANRAAISKFNLRDIIVTKEPTKKTAKRMYGVFRVTPESTIADKNVELIFAPYHLSGYWYAGDGMSVSARNKTDQTIYIYLGNTFFMRHGTAEPFTQSSASQSARDGQSAAATGFSQSVIAVPANSSLDLGSQIFVTKEKSKYGAGFYYYDMGVRSSFIWTRSKDEQVCKLEEVELGPGDSPFDYGFKMTYSFSENNTQLYSLDTKFYLAKLIGDNRNSWTGGHDGIEFQNYPLYMMFEQSVRSGGGGMFRTLGVK